MIGKATGYKLAKFGCMVVSVGAVVVLYSGQAEPFLSPSQLPAASPLVVFAGAAAVGLLGVGVVTVQETRSFRAAGRRAGLTQDGRGGLLGKPAFSGSVGGRTVRARTVKRKSGSSSRGSTNTATFTVVEADLDRPAEAGLLVCPADGGRMRGRLASIDIDPAHADVADDRLAAVGGTEAVARAVVSGRARSALLELDGFDIVFVGNASDALEEALPDVSDSRLASWFEAAVTDRVPVPGDASTVAIETEGLVLDGDRLRRQVEAVAAVADAFEEAAAGGR